MPSKCDYCDRRTAPGTNLAPERTLWTHMRVNNRDEVDVHSGYCEASVVQKAKVCEITSFPLPRFDKI